VRLAALRVLALAAPMVLAACSLATAAPPGAVSAARISGKPAVSSAATTGTATAAAHASDSAAPVSGGGLRYRYMTDPPTGDPTERYGYNLADTNPQRSLIDALPAGQRALVWIGPYDPSTCAFALSDADIRVTLTQLAGDPKVAGYYVADEADDALPAYGGKCPRVASQVAARSALVHRLAPGAFTYEVVTEPPNFQAFAAATDVLGTDPYPCTVGHQCDMTMIPRYIAALRAAHVAHYWGVLQAFSFGKWRFPTAAELQEMIGQWEQSGWEGEQTFAWAYNGQSLTRHPGLLAVLRALNLGL
jgi:hypothetical protein